MIRRAGLGFNHASCQCYDMPKATRINLAAYEGTFLVDNIVVLVGAPSTGPAPTAAVPCSGSSGDCAPVSPRSIMVRTIYGGITAL